MLRFIILTITALIASGVLLSSFVLLTLIFKPDLLVNKETLSWAQERFFSQYSIDWSRIQFQVSKKSLNTYFIEIQGEGLCQKLDKYGEACFENLDIAIEIQTNLKAIQKINIVKLRSRDDFIKISLPKENKAQDSELDIISLKENLIELKEQYENIILGEVDIIFDQIEMGISGSVYNIHLEINDRIQFQVIDQKSKTSLSGKLNFTRNKIFLENAFSHPSFKLNGKTEIPINREREVQIDSLLVAEFTKTPLNALNLKVFGHLTDESLEIDLQNIQATFKKFPLKELETPECQIQLIFKQGHLDFKCPQIFAHANLQSKELASLKKYRNEIPKKLEFKLSGEVPKTWFLGEQNFKEESEISILMKPIHHQLFKLEFDVSAKILMDKNRQFTLSDTSGGLLFRVEQFQSLTKRLENTKYAIPAPLNVMKGNIELKIDDLPLNEKDYLQVPFNLNSQLQSERNSLVGFVRGSYLHPLKANLKPELLLEAQIEKLHLQLPPLDPIRGIPALSQDSRIKEELKSQSTKSPLNLHLSLSTTRPDSIRIYHPYLSPYASFGLKAQAEHVSQFSLEKSPSDFDITYLKRKVTMRRLKVSQSKDQKEVHVDGQLLYEAPDYEVYIDFKGPSSRPEIVLTSKPPLNRSDIISVLLYNQPSSNISSFERENVGGTEAAISDRALGLFGLWAFASTPIENVSYNSVTKSYSAQIKLPEGFRLNIGTNWESVQNLELKRRLGGDWVISTIYRPRTDAEQEKGEVMLQRRISY